MQLTVGACPVACEVREGRDHVHALLDRCRDPAHGRSCANVCRMSKSRQRPPMLRQLRFHPAQLQARIQTRISGPDKTTGFSEAYTPPPELIHAVHLDSSKGNRRGNCRVYPPFPHHPRPPTVGIRSRCWGLWAEVSFLWGRSAPGYLWALGHPGELLGRCPRWQMVTLNLWGPLPGLPAKACPNWGPSHEERRWVGAGYMAETPQRTVLPWTLCQKTENR